ncbi:MAG: 50S ribosome-binding GTPase, partial [Planctomycetia bacterium]|nr:50S ribosome-binding GTPase [Planctomycetia bacterium]
REPYFGGPTRPGRGGIAVLRLLGPGAIDALSRVFRPAKRGPADFTPGRLHYGHITDAEGSVIDEVIVNVVSAASDTVDINCHGGSAAVQAISKRLEDMGLRRCSADDLAPPAGTDAVTRAALKLLPRLATEPAARMVLRQMGGVLACELRRIADLLKDASTVEAEASLETLLQRWEHTGRPLTQPARVAVAGCPNAGKSTLINALVGAERVITSPIAGTTRDYVEALAAIGGVPIILIDTAGMTEARDIVEEASVEHARGQMESADALLWVVDGTCGITPRDREAMSSRGRSALVVWNKSDVAPKADEPALLAVSALTGENLDALGSAILKVLGYAEAPPEAPVPFTAEQACMLGSAKWLLERAPKAARGLLLSFLASH